MTSLGVSSAGVYLILTYPNLHVFMAPAFFTSLFSFYDADGTATEYFWSIDRKIQFGELWRREDAKHCQMK
jgi:hypothetical protein